MGFVVKLPMHLDRAVAVLAAQRGVSKGDVIQLALQEFLWNNLVVGEDSEPDVAGK